jgi:hypothetical protein
VLASIDRSGQRLFKLTMKLKVVEIAFRNGGAFDQVSVQKLDVVRIPHRELLS